MTKISRKQYEKAVKADLIARRYVLLERLNNCNDSDQFLDLNRQLDVVTNHLECIKVRESLRDSDDVKMRIKVIRSSKEICITKRSNNVYKRSLSHS